MSNVSFLIEQAIEPKSRADSDRLPKIIQELVAEDPTFGTSTDPESGQTLIKGVSEAQLCAKVSAIRSTHKVDANVGAPQVAFHETISERVVAEYQHRKHLGPMWQYAKVRLLLAPTDPGQDPDYVSKIVGGAIAAEYLPGVERGVRAVFKSGPIAGFPMFGLRVELIDGAYHDIDSSQLAFEICARAAMRDGLKKAGAVLLQPIMRLEVTTPVGAMAKVRDDLKSRLAEGIEVSGHDSQKIITALVPMMNLFGYGADLASLTQGQGMSRMEFSHYALVPSRPDDDQPFPPAIGMRA